jgi:biopolymer transport protein ExbD
MKPAVHKRKEGLVGKIQMAPMIDIVFQLLIFFLIASEVRPTEADFKTNIPGGTGPRNPKVEAKEAYRVYLRNLDPEGRAVEVSLNNEVLPGDAFKELEKRLRSVSKKQNMPLVIDGDPTVRLQFIANALDSAVAAEVPQITFGKPKT